MSQPPCITCGTTHDGDFCQEKPKQNTDRELWRQRPGDFYSDSIHVTQDGRIGINVGGNVIVMSVQRWHEAGRKQYQQPDILPLTFAPLPALPPTESTTPGICDCGNPCLKLRNGEFLQYCGQCMPF